MEYWKLFSLRISTKIQQFLTIPPTLHYSNKPASWSVLRTLSGVNYIQVLCARILINGQGGKTPSGQSALPISEHFYL